MSDLLTRTEYQAIADSLVLPRAAFIDGKFQAGKGAPLTTINPATGETLAEIAACSAEDVDFAVHKAREAFDQGHWSKMHPSERKGVLIRLSKLMTRNRRELAVLESIESSLVGLFEQVELINLPLFILIHCLSLLFKCLQPLSQIINFIH